MLLYDWNKIFEASQGNPLQVYIILRMLVNEEIPRNKKDKIYKYASMHFAGESFLLHGDVLLHYAYLYEYREIAQYLALASLRPYADYITTGELALDLRLVELDLAFIEDNRLLRIENGKIHFKYEEVNKENIH